MIADQSRSAAEPLRHQQVSETARTLLDTEGESGRFEFKRDATAVNPKVLVAAANWVAVNNRDKVVLLVGVEEDEDPETGLVTGKIRGIRNLETASATIQNYSKETRPVPVSVTVIEEGVATEKPFLRLEIRPTFPPHYDAEGRRVTRDGKSTRALADEELLDIYLDREAAKFEQRFQQTADRVTSHLGDIDFAIERVAGDLGDLDSSIDRLSDDFRDLHSTAWRAAEEAEESKSLAEQLEESMQDLKRDVGGQLEDSPIGLFYRLMDRRWFVWDCFSLDAVYRPTKKTDQLTEQLKELLERPIQLADWSMNLAELEFWGRVIDRRGKRGTMTAWAREIDGREKLTTEEHPVMEDRISKLRAERERIHAAKPHNKSSKPKT